MRSRAPLVLMEQLVMVLVFALAAALCVQVFAFSDRASRHYADQDRAVAAAQNAAEVLKGCGGDFAEAAGQYGGDWNGAVWGISYDGDWQPCQEQSRAAYHVLVTPAESDQPLLGCAQAAVYTASGEMLFSIPVAWQEVTGHA
ncbi:hypothetical protein [uncultured Oscillibacter sp.]|uniref:hypothetical protein n=1 Tax=uncultured Oscillibacter sp. TaxID=876091 RepID=UPI0025F0146F|nr:hypothetical protein [uncultured Oscillibacter sp.]